MTPKIKETEKFIHALGVTIVEVEDLDGKCALWSAEHRRVRVCASLCERRRQIVYADLLRRLSDIAVE